MDSPQDKHGRPVVVGSKVRVLQFSRSFIDTLPDDEAENVRSMVGEVFEVYEIDEYGSPWVQKVWHLPEGQSNSHSVALTSSEMELVDESAL
jgi:hypothetical protein